MSISLEKSFQIIDSANFKLSDISPSDYAESKRIMTSDVSAWQGPFSYTRTPYLKEVINCLSPDHPAHTVAVMKGAQIGFALDINTPIPTPEGWSLMKDLKIGDKVFDETGEICNVIFATDIMYDHECYDVYFSDGNIIKCDKEHLWEVWDEKKYEYRKKVVLNTETIKNTFKLRTVRNRYAINVTRPLCLSIKELPIHPYLLGLWLGDGSNASNCITSSEYDKHEITRNLNEIGYNVIESKAGCKGQSVTLRIRKPIDVCAHGHKYPEKKISGKRVCYECAKLRYHKKELPPIIYKRIGEEFEKLNLYRNKHIPEIYLRASFNQRLELLQGLMDSDGHINLNGACEWYNIDKELISKVYELLMSLGIKARIYNKKQRDCEIIPGKIYKTQDIQVIYFRAPRELKISKLKRKYDNQKYKYDTRNSEIERRRIVDVKLVESIPVKCIQVDSPSHLYLAGKSMIPTHNTAGVIENGICWIISEQPGPIIFMCADKELTKENVEKRLEQAIDSCGLRPLIRPNTIRQRNQRTGDTATTKEFAGGYFIADGVNNPNKLRNRSLMYGFIDDFDSAPMYVKKEGSFSRLLDKRFASYSFKKKLFKISTPTIKGNSNVEIAFLLGDQRYYHLPCPECGEYISIQWRVDSEIDHKVKAGIYFKLDEKGKLIENSVGYICQKCGGFWKEQKKYELLNKGIWIPTAQPSEPGYYSYHISSLYAPAGMYNWVYYAREFLECYPNGLYEKANTENLKTFLNTCLGQTYEERGKDIKIQQLARNTRDYEIGTVPSSLSEKDGNGRIVMLTCSCDLNGFIDDARLDYEVLAHTETGSTYSVDAGSIGTFKRGLSAERREQWTYRNNEKVNNIWNVFLTDVLQKGYKNDEGRTFVIMIAGIDTGNFTNFAYSFIDENQYQSIPLMIVGLKGDVSKLRKIGVDTVAYHKSKERENLYILEVNQLKDLISDRVELAWHEDNGLSQPSGFMNFPTSAGGKYTYKDYFMHFEAEQKVPKLNTDGSEIGYSWHKKHSSVANHFFDCAVYQPAIRDIFVENFLKAGKYKDISWGKFCEIIKVIK